MRRVGSLAPTCAAALKRAYLLREHSTAGAPFDVAPAPRGSRQFSQISLVFLKGPPGCASLQTGLAREATSQRDAELRAATAPTRDAVSSATLPWSIVVGLVVGRMNWLCRFVLWDSLYAMLRPAAR
jgi:hypothetical protein